MTPSNICEAQVSPDAMDRARAVGEALAARTGRERVQVRSAFVEAQSPTSPPPLTQLLRGGRGGEVKVKLLLSMLFAATAAPYNVNFPARSWAVLLGLPDPETKGAARVNSAIRKLDELGYVRVEKRPGQPSRVFLREETGSKNEYTHPGDVWVAVKDADSRTRRKTPRYMQLPVELWTSGWIAALSGPALAMLLILMNSARGKEPSGLWFSQSVIETRYGLAEATRRKGFDELEAYGLVAVQRARIVRDELSTGRYRNTYSVNVERFPSKPEEAWSGIVVKAGERRKRVFTAPQSAEEVRAFMDRLGMTPVRPQKQKAE